MRMLSTLLGDGVIEDHAVSVHWQCYYLWEIISYGPNFCCTLLFAHRRIAPLNGVSRRRRRHASFWHRVLLV